MRHSTTLHLALIGGCAAVLSACSVGLDRLATTQEADLTEPSAVGAEGSSRDHMAGQIEGAALRFPVTAPISRETAKQRPYHVGTHAPPPFEVISTWEMNDLRWCLGLHSDDLARSTQLKAIDKATRTWSRHDGISLSRVSRCETADIVINFYAPGTPDTDFADPEMTSVVASSGVPSSAHQIEIQVNDGMHWVHQPVTEEDATIDLETTILHELGHALGLGHSEVVFAVMYPYYTGTNRGLSWDDVHGIRTMYGETLGPCAESAEVAMLAYEAALESVWAADRLVDDYERVPAAVRASDRLSQAQEQVWDGYYAAYYSDLIGAEHAEVAVERFEAVLPVIAQGKNAAHNAWLATGSEDAADAAAWAMDARKLVRAAKRHATVCDSGIWE